jgi:hypothetical protein
MIISAVECSTFYSLHVIYHDSLTEKSQNKNKLTHVTQGNDTEQSQNKNQLTHVTQENDTEQSQNKNQLTHVTQGK